ncbi:dynamin family protein [uncultured Aliiroseovarius sp.]|uniref:dynamin family protein n=1 Tax=uncultured Aliiroseovarius sp. TaxID=1658783 RepID=UPI002626B94C|nr:dynamin family protein [uncultured Aliiroseovarius sp.]
MINFPETDSVLGQLKAFLSKTEAAPRSAPLDGMRTLARGHIDQLTSAVTIGFAGEFGAGKSSLANMLAGTDILPTGPQHLKLPLVIVQYAPEPETTVGWWEKASESFPGIDLEKAAEYAPDFISVGLPSEALQELVLFDLPGSGALDESYKQTLELLKFVDCAIWCTNGTNAWRETERFLWSHVAKELQENSLLAVTHTDLTAVQEALPRLMPHLERDSEGMFQAVVPIGTPVAVQAMAQEPEPDFELWSECGGEDLAQQVLGLAATRKTRDLETAKNDLETKLTPALAALGVAEEPAETDLKEAAAAVAAAAAAAEKAAAASEPEPEELDLDNPLLDDWKAALRDLLTDLRDTPDLEVTDLLQRCQELVDDFTEQLEPGQSITPSAEWIVGEFENASDLLTLMQFEDTPHAAETVLNIMTQLSDNLSWAGTQPKDA